MTNLSQVAALIAVVFVALAAPPASAQEEEAKSEEKSVKTRVHVKGAISDERLAEFEKRLKEAQERLQLTNEQIEPLLQVLWDSFDARRAVLEAHGIELEELAEGGVTNKLNLRQLREFRRDMDEVHEAMYAKIGEQGFLSDEQFAEFKKMQEEQREALREALRARRDG